MPNVVIRAAIAVACVAASLPAGADEGRGFFLFGDFLTTEPTNAGQQIGSLERELPDDTVRLGRLAFDYGADPSFRTGLGFDGGDGGRVTVSFWDYSEELSDIRSVPAEFRLDSFNSTDYEGPFSLDSMASIDASSLTLDFRKDHDLSGDWTFRWRVGLRRVEYEESQSLVATSQGRLGPGVACGGINEPVCDEGEDRRRLDVDAFGVVVGVGGSYELGNRTSLVGELAISLLSGESDSTRSRVNTKADPDQVVTLAGAEDVTGFLTDVSAGMLVELTRGLELSILLEFGSWDDLVTDFAASGENPFAEQTTPLRDNVTFKSLAVGLSYRFGRR